MIGLDAAEKVALKTLLPALYGPVFFGKPS
jgi:hypothetical protein